MPCPVKVLSRDQTAPREVVDGAAHLSSDSAAGSTAPGEGDAGGDAISEVDDLLRTGAKVVHILLRVPPEVDEPLVTVVAFGQTESASELSRCAYLNVRLVEEQADRVIVSASGLKTSRKGPLQYAPPQLRSGRQPRNAPCHESHDRA